MNRRYLKKIRRLGIFYGIRDMQYAPAKYAMFADWDEMRFRILAELHQLRKENRLLLQRVRNRESYTGQGFKTIEEAKLAVRNTPEYKRNMRKAKALKAELEHQFRRELECPLATHYLSQKAYHVYLEMMQHEAEAARGHAYAFTLVKNFSNRSNLIQELRRAGFIVHWTIGCVTLPFDGDLDIPKETPSETAKPRRTRGQKYLERLISNPVCREIPHVHGLAVTTDRVKGTPIAILGRILGKGTFLKPITPPKQQSQQTTNRKNAQKQPEGEKKIKITRATALAQGFAAYAVYMAKNCDEPCSIKNLNRHGSGRNTQKLSKSQKALLHPRLTRGQLEAWHRAKEAIRARIGAPTTGRQWWILQHWEEIAAATKLPKYKYPAKVILRDGFEYRIKPDWDYEFQTVGVRSVACSFERELHWQEKDADRHRLGLDPKSRAPYLKTGGECEFDILLHLGRFRRVIQHHESPECPVYSYCSCDGQVRPHIDRLLPCDAA
jgi:hypothetical protein